MKKILILSAFVALLFGCKKTSTDPVLTPSQTLVSNAWKIDRLVSTTTNKILSSSDYGSQAVALFYFDFNFKDNNIVRAADRTSKEIKNTGTWYLVENNTIMNFDLEAIGKIDFDVIKITQQEMILRVKGTAKFAGLDNTVNMVLVPSL